MNLSPDWCKVLQDQGWEAVHWSAVGEPTASDTNVMLYAREKRFVVYTHDLDVSAILAASHADAPSVIQVRAQDTLSAQFLDLLVARHTSSNASWKPELSWSSSSSGRELASCRSVKRNDIERAVSLLDGERLTSGPAHARLR